MSNLGKEIQYRKTKRFDAELEIHNIMSAQHRLEITHGTRQDIGPLSHALSRVAFRALSELKDLVAEVVSAVSGAPEMLCKDAVAAERRRSGTLDPEDVLLHEFLHAHARVTDKLLRACATRDDINTVTRPTKRTVSLLDVRATHSIDDVTVADDVSAERARS